MRACSWLRILFNIWRTFLICTSAGNFLWINYWTSDHVLGFSSSNFKGIVKWAEPCKCIILLVSRILWHKRINLSLKEWRFWYLMLTSHFPPWFILSCLHSTIPMKAAYLIGKNLWHRVLQANKKQVPLKSYSLEIRMDSVNQILKNKEKVK